MRAAAGASEKEDFRTSAWFKQPGLVYFVSAGADCESCKSIKIGVTLRERLLKRLNAIQSCNHTRIRLLRVIECASMDVAEKKEKQLHEFFATHARVKGEVGYEWFRASDGLAQCMVNEGILPSEMVYKPKCLGAVLRLYGETTRSEPNAL